VRLGERHVLLLAVLGAERGARPERRLELQAVVRLGQRPRPELTATGGDSQQPVDRVATAGASAARW